MAFTQKQNEMYMSALLDHIQCLADYIDNVVDVVALKVDAPVAEKLYAVQREFSKKARAISDKCKEDIT